MRMIIEIKFNNKNKIVKGKFYLIWYPLIDEIRYN